MVGLGASSCIVLCLYGLALATQDQEWNVRVMLEDFNREYLEMSWLQQSSKWNFSTNMTKSNAESMKDLDQKFNLWMKGWKDWARELDDRKVQDQSLRRMVSLMISGVVCSDPKDARSVSELRTSLSSIYASGKVLVLGGAHNGTQLVGENQVNAFMAANLDDPLTLASVWTQWQRNVGTKTRTYFIRLVSVLQKCATQNGYGNYGEAFLSDLEMADPIGAAVDLWTKVRDLYHELHTYVRRKLTLVYGSQALGTSRTIPVHLLGSLWGYDWRVLEGLVSPFRSRDSSEDSPAKDVNGKELVLEAEGTLQSMGLPSMTKSFWTKSQLNSPKDGRMSDCHSAAFDMALDDDFRLRFCSGSSADDRATIFHELGHIMYFMAYRDQKVIFRNGANSAFHEALGDLLADALLSPPCPTQQQHLLQDTREVDLAFLMHQALIKVTILPWALTLDLWRHRVFTGQSDHLNEEWWQLREYFQGVVPPEEPDPEDFDPGSKYHVANFMPYLRYFFSRFLEFQFLESLCGEEDVGVPLHRCCLAGKHKAGEKLWRMMSLGSSEPWPRALRMLTNTSRISAEPFLLYFRPLHIWLKEQNGSL